MLDRVRRAIRHGREQLGRNAKALTYARIEDGRRITGSVTTLDGAPRATWTVRDDRGRRESTTEVEQETFDELWAEAHANWMASFRLDRASGDLDPERFHIVGVVLIIAGRSLPILYRVPGEERREEWLTWYARLRATGVPATGADAADLARGP